MAFTFQQLIKEPNVKNIFQYMGDNPNSAIVVAVAIAVCKGIFRPIFTMHDKKSDLETKRYTAMRERLTELIAVPVYIAVPLIGGKLVVEKCYKNASEITKKAVGANTKFLAVLASTAIIPAFCNVIQPPIMEAYKKKQEAKKLAEANIPEAPVVANKPSFSGNYLPYNKISKINYGMRVGS